MGVPVRVKYNYSVSGLQVEAEASSSCAQEEDKILRPWIIESLQ